MITKQEAIEKIKRKTEYFKVKKEYNRGFRDGLNSSIPVIREIDEPKKPVVSQFVADWYEDHKGNLEYNLYLYQMSIYDEKVEKDNFYYWMQKSNNPVHTLVNMHQFGYEIEKEKEKLYEVFLKRNGAQLGVCIPDGEDKTQFTEKELKEFEFDNLNVYEVKEVEE